MAGGFESLGAFAEAGSRATALALEAARVTFEVGRVPIAGAAVHMDASGALSTVAVGWNGRIPAAGSGSPGYPTDHGETAAVRNVEHFEAVDWSRVVFATTLSPCIMCSRTLTDLHGRGLNKVVIAESRTYPGTKERLAALPGMTLVELEDPGCVERMRTFARTYPWDWAADIGEIPPANTGFALEVALDPPRLGDSLAAPELTRNLERARSAAAVFGPAGRSGSALDGREGSGGNPVNSAVMRAMGSAGSAINLRECVLEYHAVDGAEPLTIESFGLSSLGACELFRPALLVTNREPAPDLAAALEAAGVRTLTL